MLCSRFSVMNLCCIYVLTMLLFFSSSLFLSEYPMIRVEWNLGRTVFLPAWEERERGRPWPVSEQRRRQTRARGEKGIFWTDGLISSRRLTMKRGECSR